MASKTKHKKSGGSLTPSKVAKHAPFPKHVYVTQDIPAICRALRTPATLAMRETKSGEVMVETKSEPPAALKNLLRDLLAPRSGRSGMMYRGRISLNGAIIANSGLGKYLQFWSASTSLLWNAVSTAAEFTTLDVLFDEFFIHSVHIRYYPRNVYQGNSASASSSGSPGDLNTCAAMCSCLMHNASAYTDNSSAFQNMSVARSHKLVHLGQRFSWRIKNIERFDPNGPLGDQTTATSTMSWCQISAAAKYGGLIQIATPVATAASAAVTTLLASGQFGDFLMTFDISWRARA